VITRLLRWLRWSLGALFAIACAAAVALVVYIESEDFQRWFETRALTLINEEIQGSVSWDRLEGSLWTGWRAHRLKLRHQERDVFSADSAEVGYALLPLLWKRIEITRLAASAPVVNLSKLPNGEWNLMQALSSRQPSSGPFQWTVAIRGINIADGEVSLRPVMDRPDLYRLRQLSATGNLNLAEGLNVQLERVASWVDTPQQEQIYASGGLTYRQNDERQSLEFENFWLQNRRSKLMLAGAIKDLVSLDSDLRLTIGHLAAADLTRYVSDWPAGVDLSGEARVNGPGKAMDGRFDVQLSSRGQIYGTARANLLDDAKPYNAAVHVRALALAPILRTRSISGALSADLNLSGAGEATETIEASGTAQVTGLWVHQREVGAVSARGSVRNRAADLTGAIEGALGRGRWQAQLRFAAKPEYRATLALSEIDPVKLAALKELPPARLNLTAQLNGTGTDPSTMAAQLDIDLQASHWGAVKIDGGKIAGRIAGGRLHIQTLNLQAAGATLAAEGSLAIGEPQALSVQYRLQAADLGPWLGLIGQSGSGRLQLNGRAEGTLPALSSRGVLAARDVKIAELSAAAADGSFSLQKIAASSWPRGSAEFKIKELRAALDFAQVQGSVALPASTVPSFTLSGVARDASGRSHRLVAEFENQPGEWRARAREIVIALPDGNWILSAPALFTYRHDDLLIERLSLRNGRAAISAAGQVSLSGAQALTVQLDGVELAALRRWRPNGAELKGVLTAQAQVRGSAAEPEIEASAAVGAGQIAGQSYRSIQARADYRRRLLNVDLVIAQDEQHDLSVRGTAPLVLAWHPSWRAEPLAGMALRAQSAGLSLAFLNALKPPVENIAGEIALDIVLSGSLADPQARGSFELSNGAFGVKRLGLRLNEINVAGNADARRLIVSRLAARSGKGAITGKGVVSLARYVPEELSLSVAARRWPALSTERYQAVIDADLRAQGPLSAPTVSGSVEVLEGTLRPRLAALEKSSVALERDPTIVVVSQRGGAPIKAPSAADKRDDNGLWSALALDLKVAIPRNLWVRHPNANVELSGHIAMAKKARAEPALTGTIEAVRGWAGFQGRRFEIARGVVQFTGAQPINPSLDIVAEYRVTDYQISALVGGTAEKPTLNLRSDPSLEQSDILALLLFGKPTSELTGNQQLSLRQNAIDIGTGFAASQLTKTVADALGLERLGLDLSDLSYSGGQVRVGSYVGQQTFVSFGQEVSGKYGREISVEYQLTPSVRIDATRGITGNNGIDIIWHKRY